jgi:hypothetical protein
VEAKVRIKDDIVSSGQQADGSVILREAALGKRNHDFSFTNNKFKMSIEQLSRHNQELSKSLPLILIFTTKI